MELILLDLLMPRMDGFAFLGELQRRGADRSVPVVVLTAKDLTLADYQRLGGPIEKILRKGSLGHEQLVAEVSAVMAGYNEDSRDGLSRHLRRKGYEVVLAVDGRQGVVVAHDEGPDLILMDMSLPVLDGWEATRRLKAESETRGIPVIALTAHAMTGDRERALETGCDDYDTKPIEFPRLLTKIEALLEKKVWLATDLRASVKSGQAFCSSGVSVTPAARCRPSHQAMQARAGDTQAATVAQAGCASPGTLLRPGRRR